MAEAHQAVAFSFIVTPEGVNWNVNAEALFAVWKSGIKYWHRKISRIQNRFHNGIYPARPTSWMGLAFLVFAMSVFGTDLSFGLIGKLEPWAHRIGFNPPRDHIVAAFWFTLILWFSGVMLRKFVLTMLLSYMGWMYELRGPHSLRTKLWHICVMVLGGRSPRLFSYQGALPKLPLPAVKDTIKRYLRSIEGLASEEEYKRTKELAQKFLDVEAPRLQRYLWLKSWWAVNYVSDWWEDYVYLASRSSLMVNSNYYGMDLTNRSPTRLPAARAANMVHAFVQYMRSINNESLKPIMLNDMVPLCSAQYERSFCTTRIPCLEKDRIQHQQWADYIAVFHAGRWYRCDVVLKDHFVETFELQSLFDQVLADKSPVTDAETHLAALTAGPRDDWAMARQQFFSKGVNQRSLDLIEKAAFCLILDDSEEGENTDDPVEYGKFGKALLHGQCFDRWFDKSFNLIVFANGKAGVNAEHGWADAAVVAQMWEVVLWDNAFNPNYGYDDKGNCRGYMAARTFKPQRLAWDISPQLEEVIERSLASARKLADDVDLTVMKHDVWGKTALKTCRVSPDAFIQMALQLAYYRDAGRFCLTYEASMTRLFIEGRTETVRSCTKEATEFVLAMMDSNRPREEVLKLFRRACERHQDLYRDAMTGKGVDRHLFCLYVISKYLGTESAFLREVLSEPWRLSTSQTPHSQTGKLDFRRHPDFISSGGGFGPVADDGYGVSYMVSGENAIFFHVSSKRSAPNTDSVRFVERIRVALSDLRELASGK